MAPNVVVAGGASADVARWFDQQAWPVDGVRGRITVLDAAACKAPVVPVHREGYVMPMIGGRIVVGASYERAGKLDAATADRENLMRLTQVLAAPELRDPQPLPESRSSARAVAVDRLPVIGALPDWQALSRSLVTRKGVTVADLPRLPNAYVAGAFASRGLIWAALAADLLAHQLAGITPTLAPDLVRAVDPARFAFRALRREAA